MSGEPAFEARCERTGETVVVVASGDLDLASADVLREVLSGPEAQAPNVILDLREVGFIDSSGLSVVVAEHRRAEAESFRFAVAVGGAPAVQRLLELTGLSETLNIVDDADGRWPA